jgi:hypothetical protein
MKHKIIYKGILNSSYNAMFDTEEDISTDYSATFDSEKEAVEWTIAQLQSNDNIYDRARIETYMEEIK